MNIEGTICETSIHMVYQLESRSADTLSIAGTFENACISCFEDP